MALGWLPSFRAWLEIARGDRGLPGPILVALLPAVLYSVLAGGVLWGKPDVPAAR